MWIYAFVWQFIKGFETKGQNPVCFLFIYLWLCWVFVSVRGLSPVVASGGHSSSRCAGLSLWRPLLLWSTGSRRAGSVIVAHGPSCSATCGILPDQGPNPCALHWQADSQPLRHQGSPSSLFLKLTAAGKNTLEQCDSGSKEASKKAVTSPGKSMVVGARWLCASLVLGVRHNYIQFLALGWQIHNFLSKFSSVKFLVVWRVAENVCWLLPQWNASPGGQLPVLLAD